MGTDIHGRIQARWSIDREYQDEGPIEDDRNYKVFAMLAGVRNGFGFAGVETHVPIVPISQPRGLPEHLGIKETDWETSPASKRYFSSSDFGDHSFSWVTLSELINWDGWYKTLKLRGIVEKREWLRMKESGDGRPNEWCGGISGGDIAIVSPENANVDSNYTHVEFSWEVPFNETCATFKAWVDYLKLKHGYRLEKDPAAIRLVFGFDS